MNWLAILLAAALIFLIATAISVIRFNRRIARQDRANADFTVREIVERCHRMRKDLKDDVAASFLYFILGGLPGKRIIWARVSVKSEISIIVIECAPDIDAKNSRYANMTMTALTKERDVFVGIRMCCPQPEVL